MVKRIKGMRKDLLIYLLIVAFGALGGALSNNVLSNYFKEVYEVNAFQRGFIEFPRELPGLLSVVTVGALSMIPDIRIAVFAQILAAGGILVLGFATPPYAIMLIFIFLNSLGNHLYMPMRQSIGISLIKDGKFGKRMGQFNGTMTAFQMLGALLVFLGFRYGLFSFETKIKGVFIAAAAFILITAGLLVYLDKVVTAANTHHKKNKFMFKWTYKYYYTLVVMFGVQKQIMMVYAPWVLIELLDKKVETIAILSIIGYFVGMFFIPAVGRWLDHFGIRKLLFADALSFIGVYLLFGLLSAGYVSGTLGIVGLPAFLAYVLFIIDRMSTQLGLVRTVYLKKIAEDDGDITPTLSFGMTLDHFVSITAAFIGGIIWTSFGPQYIFYGVAALSLVNLYVAFKVKVN